jgi:hypothetical protein
MENMFTHDEFLMDEETMNSRPSMAEADEEDR